MNDARCEVGNLPLPWERGTEIGRALYGKTLSLRLRSLYHGDGIESCALVLHALTSHIIIASKTKFWRYDAQVKLWKEDRLSSIMRIYKRYLMGALQSLRDRLISQAKCCKRKLPGRNWSNPGTFSFAQGKDERAAKLTTILINLGHKGYYSKVADATVSHWISTTLEWNLLDRLDAAPYLLPLRGTQVFDLEKNVTSRGAILESGKLRERCPCDYFTKTLPVTLINTETSDPQEEHFFASWVPDSQQRERLLSLFSLCLTGADVPIAYALQGAGAITVQEILKNLLGPFMGSLSCRFEEQAMKDIGKLRALIVYSDLDDVDHERALNLIRAGEMEDPTLPPSPKILFTQILGPSSLGPPKLMERVKSLTLSYVSVGDITLRRAEKISCMGQRGVLTQEHEESMQMENFYDRVFTLLVKRFPLDYSDILHE